MITAYDDATVADSSMTVLVQGSPTNVPSAPFGMPTEIPRGQVYYWTARWQSDEAESLAELQQGEGIRFESGRDAVRWLLEPGNDD